MDDRIASSLESLVDMRKKTALSSTTEPQNNLKHYSMFLNLDRMLQKLPEHVVEGLNVEFIQLTHREMKTYAHTT